jgi:hypothetical protein
MLFSSAAVAQQLDPQYMQQIQQMVRQNMNGMSEQQIQAMQGMVDAAASMSPEQMQRVQKMGEEAQLCENGLTPQKKAELQAASGTAEMKIAALCKAGQRDQAESYNTEYGASLMRDPQAKATLSCVKTVMSKYQDLTDMFMNNPYMKMAGIADNDTHICDTYFSAAPGTPGMAQ